MRREPGFFSCRLPVTSSPPAHTLHSSAPGLPCPAAAQRPPPSSPRWSAGPRSQEDWDWLPSGACAASAGAGQLAPSASLRVAAPTAGGRREPLNCLCLGAWGLWAWKWQYFQGSLILRGLWCQPVEKRDIWIDFWKLLLVQQPVGKETEQPVSTWSWTGPWYGEYFRVLDFWDFTLNKNRGV